MDDLVWWEIVEGVCRGIIILCLIFVIVGLAALAQAWAEDNHENH